MQSSLWKLAVIAGVVAACLLVIVHARQDLANQTAENEDGANQEVGPLTPELNASDDHLETDEDIVNDDGSFRDEHQHSGDEVSTANHVGSHHNEMLHVSESSSTIPEIDPFADVNHAEPEPLDDINQNEPDVNKELPPLIGQGEPLSAEPSGSIPRLLNETPEEDVAAADEETPSNDEPDDFGEPITSDPVGLFDAAQQEQSLTIEVEDEAQPTLTADETNKENETAVDPFQDEPTLPETEAAVPESDAGLTLKPLMLDSEPAETLPLEDLPLENLTVPEEEPSFDTELPAESQPDVSMPTAGDEDAPPSGAFLETPVVEDVIEDITVEEGGLPVMETLDAKILDLPPPPVESPEVVPAEPDVIPIDDPFQESSLEPVPATDDLESFDSEKIEDEPAAEPLDATRPLYKGVFDFGDDPQTEKEGDTEAVDEAPPLISFPNAETETPEQMLTDEVDTTSEDPAVDLTAPLPVPDIEEAPAELDEEPSLQPIEEPVEEPAPIDESADPELIPLEKIPARVKEPDAIPKAAPLEIPEVTEEKPAELPVVEDPNPDENTDVFGDGTIEENSPRGPQKPQLTIEKISPPSAILGKPFIYSIIIKNVGQSRAGRVVVEDEIPRGAKLTGTIPQAELAGKKLIWKMGTLDPGQERKISIRVIPVAEGPIGSVATVNFVSEVAAETVVTKPELSVKISAPQEAPLGKPVVFHFLVSNSGNVVARKVVLRDILPDNLKHPGGNDLEYEIGDLPVGQTRDVQLTLKPTQVGKAINQAIVTAEGDISVKAEASLKIVDAGVTVIRTGPKSRILKRAASFTNSIKNKSKTPISDIVVVEQIPEGMKFLKASPGGNFNPQKKTVTWHIQQIAGEQIEDVSVMLLPETPGTMESVIRVFGQEGELSTAKAETAIRGFSKLDLKITHAEQPLEVGERVSYRIKVHNRGTEPATGVLTSILLPEEMKLISLNGPGAHRQSAQQVDLAEIVEIGPEKTVTIDLLLQAQTAGDTRLQVQIQSDQMKKPFNREAATIVYSAME